MIVTYRIYHMYILAPDCFLFSYVVHLATPVLRLLMPYTRGATMQHCSATFTFIIRLVHSSIYQALLVRNSLTTMED